MTTTNCPVCDAHVYTSPVEMPTWNRGGAVTSEMRSLHVDTPDGPAHIDCVRDTHETARQDAAPAARAG